MSVKISCPTVHTRYTLNITQFALQHHQIHCVEDVVLAKHYTLNITHYTRNTTHFSLQHHRVFLVNDVRSGFTLPTTQYYTLHTTHYTLTTYHYPLLPPAQSSVSRGRLSSWLHTTHFTLHTTY